MYKHIKHFIVSLLLFNTAFAQERSGHGTTNPNTFGGAGGSGQIIYFAEDFADGDLPAGWVNEDPSGNGALWTYCSDPAAGQGGGVTGGCPALWDDGLNAQGPFSATTASNGFVTMDSDLVGNIATNHLSQLTTPGINLSSASRVIVSFQSQIGVFTEDAQDNALLRVSIDAGQNWTTYTIYPGLVTGAPAPPIVRWSNNPTYSQIDITAVAAGEGNVILQWQWNGNFEFLWNLDDVVVSDRFVYMEEDFSQGDIPAGWTNVDTSGNNALWSHCDDPAAGQGGGSTGGCPPLWDDALNDQGPFAATTVNNGFMTMDSDAAGNISHVSQLTSPPLDFSNASEVGLSFEGHIGVWNIDAALSAQVRVSTDDFASFTTFVPYPDLVPGSPAPPTVRWSYNPTASFFDISAVAAGQSNVKIQWQFAGNFEFLWSIDDVIITELPPFDVIFEDSFDTTVP